MIAIGNSERPELAALAIERLADESPLVRGAAVWALSRLISLKELVSAAALANDERDPTVAEEWRFALGEPEPGLEATRS
jgi:epoxyqueuosine reductase